jgi:glutathione S-transferase
MRSNAYRVHGMMQSYFTRKMTGYFEYKGIPYVLRRCYGATEKGEAAGFPGGIPMIETPDGECMWDSTPMMHYLERRHPEPATIPSDPVLRFLCYVVEDAADEWYYRTAVGSRWSFEENHRVGGFELGRDFTVVTPIPCEQAYQLTGAHVTATLRPLGITPENVQLWMDEVLRGWLRVFGAHLDQRPFLFGARPSIADFALFGGNSAHFINDPLCRQWTDEDAPSVVRHTHQLIQPEDLTYGDWDDARQIPDTLIAVLRELGRMYLPWVSRACADGTADLVFADRTRVTIVSTEFLREARGVLLARYVALRSAALDAVLERAGILRWFADFAKHATAVPDYSSPPRPKLNRGFPPEGTPV